MANKKVNVNLALARKVLSVVNKGLSRGLGVRRPGEMCVEAAVAYASGEEHTDNPSCVHRHLASIKIEANDYFGWHNNKERSRGLRRLAIAQLGSVKSFDRDRFWALVGDELVLHSAPLAVKLLSDARTPAQIHTVHHQMSVVEGLSLDVARDLEEAVQHLGYVGFNARALTCELMVRALIKMKIPGTKYLHLAPVPVITHGKTKKKK